MGVEEEVEVGWAHGLGVEVGLGQKPGLGQSGLGLGDGARGRGCGSQADDRVPPVAR